MHRYTSISIATNGTSLYESLHLIELHLDKDAFQNLTFTTKAVVTSGLSVSLLVGSYFKSALYSYMYDRRKTLSERPIDILLLVQAIVQHLLSILMILTYGIGLSLGITFSNQLGDDVWCNIPWYGGSYGLAYRIVGGFVIACFRLLLIHDSDLVKVKIGINRCLCLMLITSITVPAILVQGFALGNGPASRRQAMWNQCIGKSEEFRNILHEYSVLQGTTTIETENIPKIVLMILILCVMAEFTCYLAFSCHLYCHDRHMLKRKILKEDVIRRRNQKNAITFLGQFWSFTAEFVVLTLSIISMAKQSNIIYRVFAIILFWVEFGLISVVEVVTSNSLINYLPHKFINRRFS